TLTINKADTSTSTVIEVAGTETEVTSAALGTSVQDDARSEERREGKAITGNGTYNFYQETNGIAGLQTGAGGDTQVGSPETVAVGNDSSATGALAAGTYYYTVHYSGEASFNASDSAVETLTINKADTSTSTVIEVAGTETEVTSAALGTSVQDDA